jgi:hypothetical protein
MEIRPILVLLGLLASAAAFAQAYTWVDEKGVTHYSDRPQEGAKQVDLPEYSRKTGAQLYRQRPTAAPADDADDAEEDTGPFKYESLAIASPGAEETLWNIEGVLNVSLALSPGLQNGHRVRVYFDGKPREVSGSSIQIEEVYRGVHNVQVEVIDEMGNLMIRSQTNRFYVQQNSILSGGR